MPYFEPFSDWERAFDFTRERNAPTCVQIVAPANEPGEYILFPSGAAKRYRKSQQPQAWGSNPNLIDPNIRANTETIDYPSGSAPTGG